MVGLALIPMMAIVRSSSEEVALRLEQEERCRLVAETARVFIHHFTPEGIITYVNRYAEEVSGYTREELIGRNFLEIFVPEEDRERVVRDLRPVIEGEPVSNYESALLTKSGERRLMLWSGARTLDENGRCSGLVASGIDITELKRAQEALKDSEGLYRTLIEHSLAGVFIVQDTGIVYANKKAEEITGYTIEDVRGMNFWDLVHPDDREIIRSRAFRRLSGEEVPERYEYLLVTKSGETRMAEIWATLITYQGRPAILANVIDITERRRIEEEQAKYERELERHKQQFYSLTITAITQGKLEVLETDEVAKELEGAQVTVNIDEPSDASLSRNLVRQLALNAGLTGDRLDDFILAVGEAAANALRHAGAGTVLAGIRDGTLWVGIVDHGSGMDSLILTQAVFRKGFSTKPSLGFGYTLILDAADHVCLSTSPGGTTVVMEKEIVEPPTLPQLDLSRLPDTW
jgi:PAS domain S-box-containing protein